MKCSCYYDNIDDNELKKLRSIFIKAAQSGESDIIEYATTKLEEHLRNMKNLTRDNYYYIHFLIDCLIENLKHQRKNMREYGKRTTKKLKKSKKF